MIFIIGFRCQGCQEKEVLNPDTSYETTLECRMSNVE